MRDLTKLSSESETEQRGHSIRALGLMPQREALSESLALIFQGISQLASTFKGRRFTIDGRLVGDIGESVAGLDYLVLLDEKSRTLYDGVTPDGRKVQIKATFQNHLTFTKTPQLYLGLKLYCDGTYEEIFNGPGQLIYDRYSHRANIGEKLLRFPIGELRLISKSVPLEHRIPRRIT